MLKVGDQAPNFTGISTDGNSLTPLIHLKLRFEMNKGG